jgi:hypothetical protein
LEGVVIAPYHPAAGLINLMDLSSHQKLLSGELQYAIHHVFLPPNLPQTGDDTQAVAHGEMLLTIVSNALRHFRSYVEPSVTGTIDASYKATLHLRDVRDTNGFVNEGKLRDAFRDLEGKGMLPDPSLCCRTPS